MQIGVEYVHHFILGGAHVFHMQFEFALTLPAVEHQTVSQLGARRQGFGATKPDAVDGLAMHFQFQGQMFFTDDALADDVDLVLEHRRGKALAPDLVLQIDGHVRAQMLFR